MDIEDLREHFGIGMDINGENFEFSVEEDLSGNIAVWASKNYIIYATAGFDGISIPIALMAINYGDNTLEEIDCYAYRGYVRDFEEYCSVVNAVSEYIIQKHEARASRVCVGAGAEEGLEFW